MTLDPGFRQEGILIAFVDFTVLNIPTEARPAFKRNLIQQFRTIPGVNAVADTFSIPLSGNSSNNKVWMDGSAPAEAKDSYFGWVGPEYFKTMKTPIVAGREFDEHDTLTTTKVDMVNESYARHISKHAYVVCIRQCHFATGSGPSACF